MITCGYLVFASFLELRCSINYHADIFSTAPKINQSRTKTFKKLGMVAPKSGPFFGPLSILILLRGPEIGTVFWHPFWFQNGFHFSNIFGLRASPLNSFNYSSGPSAFVYLIACEKTHCSPCAKVWLVDIPIAVFFNNRFTKLVVKRLIFFF